MSVMDLSQLLGNLGAFIGSIAVLATLIYLADQVRQARRQLTVVGMQARANHARGVLEDIVNTSELVDIFAKLEFIDYGDYGLTEEETVRFGAWCHIWMQAEQGSFYLLPKGAHEGARKWWLATPAGREFWDKNSGFYDREFVEHMEELKAQVDSEGRSPEAVLAEQNRDA
jgi:hypothetical protein